jgi:hypothetical protein
VKDPQSMIISSILEERNKHESEKPRSDKSEKVGPHNKDKSDSKTSLEKNILS